MPFSENWTPRQRPGIVEQPFGEMIILYRADGRLIHTLNATAAAIWRLCDGRHTVPNIEQSICASFRNSNEYPVIEDVQKILDDFAEQELIARQ